MVSTSACDSLPTEQGGVEIRKFSPSGETRPHCATVLPVPSPEAVKTPGEASTILTLPADRTPLLLIEKSTVSPLATCGGSAKLTCPGETKIRRAANPLTDTVTPPRS